jgi:uncharacterized membrane protein
VVHGSTTTTSSTTTVPTATTISSGSSAPTVISTDFAVDQDLIKVVIKQGETQTKELKISNTGDMKLNISIQLQDLKKFILVSEENFSLEPNQSKTITLDFTASENEIPDVYSGRILVVGDGIRRTVRTIIEVKEKKPLFDIVVEIQEEFKFVEVGKNVKASITMLNIGETEPVDVILEYSIKDFEGNSINVKNLTIAIERQAIIYRELKVPTNAKLGDYLFYVKIIYDGSMATSSDLFTVISRKEETKFINSYIFLALLATIVAIMIILQRKLIFKIKKKK